MPLDRAPSGTPDSQLLRVSEVADYLGVSCRVVYEWVATGVIPQGAIVRAGRAVYVKRLALEEWLAGRDGTQPPMT
jgi:excisionase family DNA binding protein